MFYTEMLWLRTWHLTAALAEYVQRRQQQSVIKLFGTIDYDPRYDYKALRQRKRR